jgi:hypothetical protein
MDHHPGVSMIFFHFWKSSGHETGKPYEGEFAPLQSPSRAKIDATSI